jgi:hypothetical protein
MQLPQGFRPFRFEELRFFHFNLCIYLLTAQIHSAFHVVIFRTDGRDLPNLFRAVLELPCFNQNTTVLQNSSDTNFSFYSVISLLDGLFHFHHIIFSNMR